MRLKEFRKSLKMTQQDFAESLGLERVTYVRYENESRTIPHEVLLKIAERYNVTVDYLLGRDDSTPPTLDEQLSGISFALYGEIHDLTDDEKQDILDYVRFKRSQKKR